MTTTEILKNVRKIEIKTRGVVNQIFSGEYHSVFKGRGMNFSEVREYQYGDDIRSIDWNVSARYNHPYIKVYEEERELTVMLIVDFSRSGNFGTVEKFKNEILIPLNINFDHFFKPKTQKFFYDFYLPDYEIIIEVDGDFFHSNPKFYPDGPIYKTQIKNNLNDQQKNQWAKDNGFKLLRFWENDIKNNPQQIIEILK